MGPPASCRLDGVLCLARGLRPAWPGGRGLHLELLADRSELLRMEGCAVRRWAGVRRSRPAWRRAPRRCAGTRRPRHSSRADAWLRGRMRMRMWSSTATDRVCAPALPTASHRLSHRAMTGTHDACEVWGSMCRMPPGASCSWRATSGASASSTCGLLKLHSQSLLRT